MLKTNFRKQKGITLIALVITIIVLLILAGVSIVMLAGENGILTQVQTAKEKTEKASLIEKVQVDILGEQVTENGSGISVGALQIILNKYFTNVPTDANDISTDIQLSAKEEYGGYDNIKLSDIYNGKITGVISIPEGLEVGTTVSYSPIGTYDRFNENYSGNSGNPAQLSSAPGQAYNISKWKVFEINDTTGEVTLVPEHSTDNLGTGTVCFNGAQGYNNAVKLLNDACDALYGQPENNKISARSINIEDIERKMKSTALTTVRNNNGYENQVANAYTDNNSFYPNIYVKEILHGLNGGKSPTGIKMSEQTGELIEPNENGATNGHLQGTNLKPTQTYWYADNSFMQDAFNSSENGVNYYNLLIPDGTDTTYWVASRCVNTNQDYYCYFDVSCISVGEMNAFSVYGSYDGDGSPDFYGLFPIVSLSFELISINDSGEFEVK